MGDHPISPPPELVQQWHDAWIDAKVKHDGLVDFIATHAAHWGSDQELEACCEWLEQNCGRWELPAALRTTRRPKPPSLKKQALVALSAIALGANDIREFYQDIETIKSALETLPNN